MFGSSTEKDARRFSSVEIHSEAFTDISNFFIFHKEGWAVGSNQNELLFTMVFKILHCSRLMVVGKVYHRHREHYWGADKTKGKKQCNAPFGHFSFCF